MGDGGGIGCEGGGGGDGVPAGLEVNEAGDGVAATPPLGEAHAQLAAQVLPCRSQWKSACAPIAAQDAWHCDSFVLQSLLTAEETPEAKTRVITPNAQSVFLFG